MVIECLAISHHMMQLKPPRRQSDCVGSRTMCEYLSYWKNRIKCDYTHHVGNPTASDRGRCVSRCMPGSIFNIIKINKYEKWYMSV